MKRLIKIKNWIIGIIFPPLCIGCNQSLPVLDENPVLCVNCISQISIHTSLFCSVCKARLPDNKKTCHQNALYVLGAATHYNQDPIKNVLWFFKYKKWQRLRHFLGNTILTYLVTLQLPLTSYSIIPIPLHPDKEKSRGFNQAKLLAQYIAIKYQLPIIDQSLIRIRATRSQTECKDFEMRLHNVENCFSLTNPETVKNKNIILVDDVFTSGTTMNEAVKILKSSGAKKIIALVVAKAH